MKLEERILQLKNLLDEIKISWIRDSMRERFQTPHVGVKETVLVVVWLSVLE
jgi:hypothetical protein